MKRKAVILLLAAAVGMSSVPVMAELEAVEAVTEETAEDTAEDAANSEEAEVTDIDIIVNDVTFTIKNDTDIAFSSVEYKEEAAPEESSQDEASTVWNLILTEADGTVHTLADVVPVPDKWKDTTLVEQLGLLYIQYKDETGKDQDIMELSDEKMLDEETPVYVLTGLNLRESASTDAKVLTVLSPGNELTATAVTPGWVKVKNGDTEGYVAYRYVTTDRTIADKLLEEQAAARAAAQASTNNYSEPVYSEPTYTEPAYSEPVNTEPAPAPSDNGIVSIENYDDCDGSGHGYREITYADGSTEIEEY